MQRGYAISTKAVHYPERDAIGADNARRFTMNSNKIWIFLVLAVVMGAVLFAVLLGPGQESLEQKYAIDLPEPHQAGTIESPAVGKLAPRIADSESRVMSDQGNADSSIGAEQQPAVLPPPRLPTSDESAQAIEIQTPPAADQADAETSAVIPPPQASVDAPIRAPAAATPSTDSATNGQSGAPTLAAATSKVATLESEKPVNVEPPTPSAAKQGPWVINIASSQDKADANRLAEKARSSDFQTELQQVTVKGRQYWRVQITGFATKEEARATSGSVKEALGLKDVWITTR